MSEETRIRSWDEIEEEYNQLRRMPLQPTHINYLSDDYITDIDKSVRWNREQIVSNHERYKAEEEHLAKEWVKRQDEIFEDVYRKIQNDTGFGLSKKCAKAMWAYAFNQEYEFGIDVVIGLVQDLIDLVQTILESRD